MEIDTLLNGVLIFLCVCAVLLNLSGNGLIIISWAISPDCRNEVGLLIANAALLDLTAIPTFIFIMLDCLSTIQPYWIAKDTLTSFCHFVPPTIWICQHARTFAITSIAVNRYIRIVYNKLYVRIYLRYKLHMWCVILVFVATALFAIAIPLLFNIHLQGAYRQVDTANSNSQSLCRGHVYNAKSNKDAKNIPTIFSFLSTYLISSTLCAICYVNIFRYFFKSKRTLESFSINRNSSPIVNGNSKNLKLHVIALFGFFGAHILGLIFVVISNLQNSFSTFMYYFGVMCFSSITVTNPWTSVAYVKGFNHVFTSFKRCRSPQAHKKKIIVSNLMELHAKKTVM